MDPTSPEFRPRLRSDSIEHKPPARNDPQWRTTCRTCGEAFTSRNQLMRHLYRAHPGKPAKSKTPAKPTQPLQPAPTPLTPRPAAPKPLQSQSQIHPFTLLADQGKLAFAGQIMLAIFAVGLKQIEEEEEEEAAQQRGQSHDRDQPAHPQNAYAPDSSSPPPPPPPPPGPHIGARPATAPHQTCQGGGGGGRGRDGSESEDADSEDGGGAPLDGSEYEFEGEVSPALLLRDMRGGLDGLDCLIEDLD